MMTETGISGFRTSGREEFNPQRSLLGMMVCRLAPSPGRPGGHPAGAGQECLNICCRQGRHRAMQ